MFGIFLSTLFFACGSKEPAKTAPIPKEEPPQEEPAQIEPEVPEEPEPEPDPGIESNVDFKATLTFADGSTKSGRVVRVERNEKYNGMGNWIEKERKLKVDLTAGSEFLQAPWSDIKKIVIKPTSTRKKDSDCNFESDYDPRLYFCKQTTKSTAITNDGKKWGIDNKYKWRFYFEDESNTDFWIQTFRVMEQEEGNVRLTDSNVNHDLIGKLKETMSTALQSTMLVQIDIAANAE